MVLRGSVGGLAAVAAVTFCAFQLGLNLCHRRDLSTSDRGGDIGVRGFWEASFTSVIAVNCLNYFFVPPVPHLRVSDPQTGSPLPLSRYRADVSRLYRAACRARPERSAAAGADREALRTAPRISFSVAAGPLGRRSYPSFGRSSRQNPWRYSDATEPRLTRPGPRQTISNNWRAAPITRTPLSEGAAHTWAHCCDSDRALPGDRAPGSGPPAARRGTDCLVAAHRAGTRPLLRTKKAGRAARQTEQLRAHRPRTHWPMRSRHPWTAIRDG